MEIRASTRTSCISNSSSARYSMRKGTGGCPGRVIVVSPSTMGAAAFDASMTRTVTTASSGSGMSRS